MTEQTLKFNDIVVNKKQCQASKHVIALTVVNTDKIVYLTNLKTVIMVLNTLLVNLDDDDDDIITPLCIVLPQMSGFIKYFDDGEKNMSFKIEDESFYLKYKEIWNKIKKTLNIRFHSQPIYNEKYIKTKVKTFDSVINTLFSDNKIPKEGNFLHLC